MITELIERLILLGAMAAFVPAQPFLGRLNFLLEVNSSFSNIYVCVLLILALFQLAGKKWQAALFSVALSLPHGWLLIPKSVAPDMPLADDRYISVFYANVWIHNPTPERVADAIRARNPDIVALTEVNERWLGQLALDKSYKYTFLRPGVSADGGAIYSRYPLIGTERIPTGGYFAALKTKVQLKDGKTMALFFIHAPPPQVDLTLDGRNYLIDEISNNLQADDPAHSAVFGDFNTAFSSPSLRRYRDELGLADAFRSSWFHASWHIREFPPVCTRIDQLFTGADLQVRGLNIEPDVGSDHFPVFFQIARRDP